MHYSGEKPGAKLYKTRSIKKTHNIFNISFWGNLTISRLGYLCKSKLANHFVSFIWKVTDSLVHLQGNYSSWNFTTPGHTMNVEDLVFTQQVAKNINPWEPDFHEEFH